MFKKFEIYWQSCEQFEILNYGWTQCGAGIIIDKTYIFSIEKNVAVGRLPLPLDVIQ